MKTHRIIVAVFAMCLFVLSDVSAQKDSKKEAEKKNEKKFEDTRLEKDADFVVDAIDAGMYEVQASALAKTNAASGKVKEIANQMMDDHSKCNEELKKIAAKKNITLPEKLSRKKQDQFDKLLKLKGEEFDRQYSKMMVSDHKDEIEMFEKQAEKGKDGELKAWAASKIPMLKQHLQMAEDVYEVVVVK